ncbi:hypothetical protein AAMO2058_001496000 [Amorphochlora amoebiformis]
MASPRRLTFSRALLAALIVAFVCLASIRTPSSSEEVQGQARRLLESNELANYPDGAFTEGQKSSGAVILHTLGFFYMFAALAIVCDEFFVPALEVIADRLNLQDDVAGATFMAAGGSAPELATSFVGTFVSRSDVGFGTIVGSAVFNILFVIGTCAMFAPSALKLTWWPLARDSIFYAITLGVLIVFFFDKKIEPWEAALQFCLYLVYVILMVFNRDLERLVRSYLGLPPPQEIEDVEMQIREGKDGSKLQRPMEGSGKHTRSRSARSPRFHYGLHDFFTSHRPHTTAGLPPRLRWKRMGESVIRMNRARVSVNALNTQRKKRMSDVVFAALGTPLVSKNWASDEAIEEEEELKKKSSGRDSSTEKKKHGNSPETKDPAENGVERNSPQEEEECSSDEEPMDLTFPNTMYKQILYVILAPLTYPLYYTIPDVRRHGCQRMYAMTFLMSVVWIGVFSYLMVWWATVVGVTLGIPSEIMGLTILAIGTSVPDLLESVIVTRDGKGDMAVSSSIGSNIFDVTVGLPIPWLLYTITNKSAIGVGTNGLLISVSLLFGMLLSVLITIAASGWKLSRNLGYVFFFLWVVFVTISVAVSVS